MGVVVGLVFSLLYLADLMWFVCAVISTFVGAVISVFVDKLKLFRQNSEVATNTVRQASLLIRYGSQIILLITPGKFSRGLQYDWST